MILPQAVKAACGSSFTSFEKKRGISFGRTKKEKMDRDGETGGFCGHCRAFSY